ncbi:MAG TPA: hypothetical protein VIQ30_10525 [Pseudonocardia sp.]
MLEALEHQLNDPVGYAVPVFFLFIGIELLALRYGSDDPPRRGYLPVDARTSLLMGLGSGLRTSTTPPRCDRSGTSGSRH